VRVVIADDAPLIREGIATLLTEHDVEVVKQVDNAEALLECIRDMRPDVALIDIRMPPTHTDEGLRAAPDDPRALSGHRPARALAAPRARVCAPPRRGEAPPEPATF
jgi:DNA-binding NarL/FixJ family response regulator